MEVLLSPPYSRMWLYLEMGPLKNSHGKMRSYGLNLIQQFWFPYNIENILAKEQPRENTVRRWPSASPGERLAKTLIMDFHPPKL
jgi:hypothetical protein